MQERVIHTVQHDLESFYWLLTWIVLRHTKHTHFNGIYACIKLFGSQDEGVASSMKDSWLGKPHHSFAVDGNPPLSHLLACLKVLLGKSLKWAVTDSATIPLTYESMLAIFDEALEMDGWPENDAAIPFVPPKGERGDEKRGASSKRPRPNAADDVAGVRASKKARK